MSSGEDGVERCIICIEDCEGAMGERGPCRWGYSPCCRQVMHSRCLSKWIGKHNIETVGPRQEDGVLDEEGRGRDLGTYMIPMQTTKQCPHCRDPMHSSSCLDFD